MAYELPSATNVYVPSFDTTANLVVEFSRDPKKFPVNEYTTLTPVSKDVGLYLRLDPDNAIRLLGVDGDAYAWPDGNDPPQGDYENLGFEFQTYQTKRYSIPNLIGYKAKEQASFDIMEVHKRMLGVKHMTLRTKLVADVITNTANYPSGHTATATAAGGGQWSAGTIANPYIKKSLDYAFNVIRRSSGGVADDGDNNFSLVVGPATAQAMGSSAEVRDFIAQNPLAMEWMKGEKNVYGRYGVPPILYGVRVIIENTPIITSNREAASTTKTDIFPAATAVLMIRKGDLVAPSNAFSTCHVFSYEEMTAEVFDNVQARRHECRVTCDLVPKIVAPVTGFVFTSTN